MFGYFCFLKIPNGLCVSFDLSIKISNLNETNEKVTYVSELALQSIYAFSFNPRSLSPHLSLSLSLSLFLSLPFLSLSLFSSFFLSLSLSLSLLLSRQARSMSPLTALLVVALASAGAFAADCGAPALPANAVLPSPCAATATGDVCTIACQSGFALQGEGARVCSEDGRWLGQTTEGATVACVGKPADGRRPSPVAQSSPLVHLSTLADPGVEPLPLSPPGPLLCSSHHALRGAALRPGSASPPPCRVPATAIRVSLLLTLAPSPLLHAPPLCSALHLRQWPARCPHLRLQGRL